MGAFKKPATPGGDFVYAQAWAWAETIVFAPVGGMSCDPCRSWCWAPAFAPGEPPVQIHRDVDQQSKEDQFLHGEFGGEVHSENERRVALEEDPEVDSDEVPCDEKRQPQPESACGAAPVTPEEEVPPLVEEDLPEHADKEGGEVDPAEH